MSEFILPGRAESPAALSSMRRWAAMCHLSWLLGLVLPFGTIIGPLIVWLAKRHDYYEVDVHGKESLNFQITWTLYGALFGGLAAILAFGLKLAFISIILIGVLMIGGLALAVLPIVAAIRAGAGHSFRYPLTIRFLK
jgi:uncharacterized protein